MLAQCKLASNITHEQDYEHNIENVRFKKKEFLRITAPSIWNPSHQSSKIISLEKSYAYSKMAIMQHTSINIDNITMIDYVALTENLEKQEKK